MRYSSKGRDLLQVAWLSAVAVTIAIGCDDPHVTSRQTAGPEADLQLLVPVRRDTDRVRPTASPPPETGDMWTVDIDRTRCAPRPSPNGKRIAYVNGRRDRILIVDTEDEDAEPRPLLEGVPHPYHYPAWSPDGRRIAFVAETDNKENAEIFVANADGTDPVNLTQHPESDVFPAWSPDGNRIAFGTHRLGPGTFRLFVMNADGTEAHDLLDVDVSPWTAPAWSPDGRSIAYSGVAADGSYQLFIARSDGSRFRQLSNAGANNSYPAFSPDGRFVAYVRYDRWEYDTPASGSLVVYDSKRETHTMLLPDCMAKHECPRPVWRQRTVNARNRR